MSEYSSEPVAPTDSASTRRSAALRQLPFYAGAALLVVLGIAWFDGGEEPIRPIVQPVALAPVGETGE